MPIKSELQRLRDKRDNASGGKQYWADGCVAMGVYETDSGLRMKSTSITAGEKTKKDEGKKEDTNV